MSRVAKRRWETDLRSGLSRRDRQGCTYEAYVPDLLIGRRITLDGEGQGQHLVQVVFRNEDDDVDITRCACHTSGSRCCRTNHDMRHARSLQHTGDSSERTRQVDHGCTVAASDHTANASSSPYHARTSARNT